MMCSVGGCDRNAHRRGLCGAHYMRFLQYGEPGGSEIRPWGNSDVGYIGVHLRIRTLRGPAKIHKCQQCDKPAAHWAYDHLDPDEKVVKKGRKRGLPFSIDPDHYLPLCVRCHKRFDLAIKRSGAVS